MSRSRPIVLLAAMSACVGPSATRADQASAEAVLSDAGLVRRFPSYLLQGEFEANDLADKIGMLQAELEVSIRKYRALQGEYNSKAAEANQLESEARTVTSEYNPQTKRYEEKVNIDESKRSRAASCWQEAAGIRIKAQPIQQEIVDGQGAIHLAQSRHGMLVKRTLNQYAMLATRPEIKAALRELNRGTRPKVALGPIEAYRQNVVRQSAETMVELGLRREGDLYWLPEDADFIKQADKAHGLWRRIAVPEQRPASTVQAAPVAKRPGTAPPGPMPPRPVARQPIPARPAAALVMTATPPASVADGRAELVPLIRQLRRQADAFQGRRDALLADVEARDALEAINSAKAKAHHSKIGTKPALIVATKHLEDMERAIRAEVIPLTRDGELLKLTVLINGRPASSVVDPATAWVRLPDPLAAESGVRPEPGSPTVPPALVDGQALPARTARIGSLRVGSTTIEGVECLVLPPGPGDGPPVLGGSFLNRVVAELDVGAATLTLTRVDPPPTAKPD